MKNNLAAVEVLKNADELWMLENEFLKAVGEEAIKPENRRGLETAVEEEKIIFFAARLNGKVIGICSVSPTFSTFACKTCGIFDDFFIRPEYRGQGIARMLVNAVQLWCKERDYASLTVGCAPTDIAMYRSLGFDTELGTMLANNL